MARTRIVATATLELRQVVPGDHYVLELRERRVGAVGRMVTLENLGCAPVTAYAKDAWSIALVELVAWLCGDVIALDAGSML